MYKINIMYAIPNRLPHTSRRPMTTRIIYDSRDGFIVRYIILYYYCVCQFDFLLSFPPAASRMPFITVCVNSQRYYLYNIVQCLRRALGQFVIRVRLPRPANTHLKPLAIDLFRWRRGHMRRKGLFVRLSSRRRVCSVCVQLLVIFYRSKNMCRVHRRIHVVD
jgi:hypothetical protein